MYTPVNYITVGFRGSKLYRRVFVIYFVGTSGRLRFVIVAFSWVTLYLSSLRLATCEQFYYHMYPFQDNSYVATYTFVHSLFEKKKKKAAIFGQKGNDPRQTMGCKMLQGRPIIIYHILQQPLPYNTEQDLVIKT